VGLPDAAVWVQGSRVVLRQLEARVRFAATEARARCRRRAWSLGLRVNTRWECGAPEEGIWRSAASTREGWTATSRRARDARVKGAREGASKREMANACSVLGPSESPMFGVGN
jgi:hypothetical protein